MDQQSSVGRLPNVESKYFQAVDEEEMEVADSGTTSCSEEVPESLVKQVENIALKEKKQMVEAPKTEEGWKSLCLERWPGTYDIIEKDSCFSLIHKNITWEQFYAYMHTVEEDWFAGKYLTKIIRRPFGKNPTEKWCYWPVGVSKRFMVVLCGIDSEKQQHKKKEKKEDASIEDFSRLKGRIHYLQTDRPYIVTKNDYPNKPKLWRPKWRVCSKFDIVCLKKARLCHDILVLVHMTQSRYVASIFKLYARDVVRIAHFNLLDVPEAMVCTENACVFAYKDDGGLYVLRKVSNWEPLRILDNSVYSLDLNYDDIGNSVLMCGIKDKQGLPKTCGIFIGKFTDADLCNIRDNPYEMMWKKSFWSLEEECFESNLEDAIPSCVKYFSDPVCSGYQFVQTCKKHMYVSRLSSAKDIHNYARFAKDTGTFVGFDMCGSVIAAHHSTNDIMILNHAKAFPPKKVISLKGQASDIADCRANFLYDSVASFVDRIVVLMPDGSAVFICLKKREKYY